MTPLGRKPQKDPLHLQEFLGLNDILPNGLFLQLQSNLKRGIIAGHVPYPVILAPPPSSLLIRF